MIQHLTIRKTTPRDLDAVMGIIAEAVESLRSRGVDQWQDGYPNAAAIQADMEAGISYVACLDSEGKEQILGTAAISFAPEPTYREIYDGAWRAEKPYAVIHRIATAEAHKGCGVATALLEFARKSCRERGVSWIRIDTHRDNLVMQKFLEKEGFRRCGSITLDSGAHRFGFDAEVSL